MGWMYMARPAGQSHQAFFQEQFGSDCQILDSHTTRFVFYAACENKRKPGAVFAVICLFRYARKDYYNFGFKDMDESMGPYAYDCPNRILDMLTPTDNEYANKWRSLCRARNDKPSPRIGQTIELAQPVPFGGVFERRMKRVTRKAYESLDTGRLLKFGDLRSYDYQIVNG